MTGTPGRRAVVKVSGAPVVITNEATTNLGDDKTYRITNAAKRVLDPYAAVTVKIGGSAMAPNGADPWKLNRLTGTVTFAAANGSRGSVTVDGSYLPLATVVRCRSYAWNISASNADDTDFDTAWTDNGFTRRVQTLKDMSGTLSGKWSTDLSLTNALLNATFVVLEFFTDRGAARDVICWAQLSKQDVGAAVDSINEYSVEFQSAGDADGNVAAQ